MLITSVFRSLHRPVRKRTAQRDADCWREPGGSTLHYCAVDFNSSVSRLYLRSPEGRTFWVENVHLEIVEPERIVFSGTLQSPAEGLISTPGKITFRRIERHEGMSDLAVK